MAGKCENHKLPKQWGHEILSCALCFKMSPNSSFMNFYIHGHLYSHQLSEITEVVDNESTLTMGHYSAFVEHYISGCVMIALFMLWYNTYIFYLRYFSASFTLLCRTSSQYDFNLQYSGSIFVVTVLSSWKAWKLKCNFIEGDGGFKPAVFL